jgi:hypothetical protein
MGDTVIRSNEARSIVATSGIRLLKLRLIPFLWLSLPFVRLGFLLCTLACALLATYDFGRQVVVHNLTLSDFTVFWTAARFERVYDTVEFTRAQLEHFSFGDSIRPFPYPPTALLFVKPLQWFSFEMGAMIWTAAGVAAFLFACNLYGRAGHLAVLAPMAALSVLAGQASLLLGAGLSAGVALADRRPIIAGILFGLVGSIKPTMAALVPLALILAGNKRALATAVIVGASIVAASLVRGPSYWIDWIQSLPAFMHQVAGRGFRQTNVAPGLWFAPLGLATVAYVFHANKRADVRLIALVSGTACCTPYMMGYDMVTMAPAAAALMLKRNPLGWIVGSLAFAFVFLRLAPEIAIGCCVLTIIQSWALPRLARGGYLGNQYKIARQT